MFVAVSCEPDDIVYITSTDCTEGSDYKQSFCLQLNCLPEAVRFCVCNLCIIVASLRFF